MHIGKVARKTQKQHSISFFVKIHSMESLRFSLVLKNVSYFYETSAIQKMVRIQVCNHNKLFTLIILDIEYLKKVLPKTTEPEFFEYLHHLDARDLTFYAIPEGSVVFPKVPLIRLEGPLPVCQLLETTLLTLVNYASLITTNATRYRIASQAASQPIQLLEFGLRRAQGPDGGLSASKYAYLGGFDATSNVLAGKLYGIPVKGTHAHAFVMSYKSVDELKIKVCSDNLGK